MLVDMMGIVSCPCKVMGRCRFFLLLVLGSKIALILFFCGQFGPFTAWRLFSLASLHKVLFLTEISQYSVVVMVTQGF